MLGDGACAFFRTGSFATSARFVEAIGDLPGVDGPSPRTSTSAAGGVTVRLLTYTDD